MDRRENGSKPTRKPPNVELKEEIEKGIESSDYVQTFRRAKFVSLGFIADLFESTNPPKLRLSIQADLEFLRAERPELQIMDIKIEKLVDYVKKEASKLYAVLLLVGQLHRIVQLYNNDHRVTDHIFEQGEDSNAMRFCVFALLPLSH